MKSRADRTAPSGEKRRIDDGRTGRRDQQGVAVSRGSGNALRADVAGGTAGMIEKGGLPSFR